MFKKRILIILSLLMLVASFQSANAGLGSITTDKTSKHYSSMLNQDMQECCDCDKAKSCKSACLGTIGCLEKNLFKNHEITFNTIKLYKQTFNKQLLISHINPTPSRLLRPPQ